LDFRTKSPSAKGGRPGAEARDVMFATYKNTESTLKDTTSMWAARTWTNLNLQVRQGIFREPALRYTTDKKRMGAPVRNHHYGELFDDEIRRGSAKRPFTGTRIRGCSARRFEHEPAGTLYKMLHGETSKDLERCETSPRCNPILHLVDKTRFPKQFPGSMPGRFKKLKTWPGGRRIID
jgi:hypothetical protein